MNTLFTLLGLMIAAIKFEIGVFFDTQDPNKEEWQAYPNPMDNPRNSGQLTNVFRIMVLFTSLIAVCCNI